MHKIVYNKKTNKYWLCVQYICTTSNIENNETQNIYDKMSSTLL